MPSKVPMKRAERRLRTHTGRLAAASTEKSQLNALVGWLLGEFYKIRMERRPHWMRRWMQLAMEMNEETRNDGQ